MGRMRLEQEMGATDATGAKDIKPQNIQHSTHSTTQQGPSDITESDGLTPTDLLMKNWKPIMLKDSNIECFETESNALAPVGVLGLGMLC